MLRSIIALCVLSIADCARILTVVPTPSVSHQVIFRPLTQELARRGHEVVYITTDPAFPKGKAPANLTEIDLHDISYKSWEDFMLLTSAGSKSDLISQIETSINMLRDIFMTQLATDEVQEIIQNKNKTFDLIFVEAITRPALIFSHLYNAHTIQVSSFGGYFENYESVGAPVHPLVYPLSSRQRINNLTVWEKISELYKYYVMSSTVRSLEKRENEMLRELFGPDVPPLFELQKNVEMLFLNVHPIWDGNRPVPPSVVYIGGIHQKPKKDLPQDLKTYLDSSKKGVIYVSFGTNVSPSMLPPHKIQAMVDAFSQLPFDVLWKWDKDELPGRSKNIKIIKWVPQSDMLRHPKIKLFIMQGGLQSTDEAVIAGVPLIGIPMLGDQWYNVEKYVQLKMGLKLEMEDLTKETLKEAIETVINDESYRRNVAKFGAMMHDQPQQALDRAVWWTEHILRHGGGSHLRAPTVGMSWAEFLVLDVVLVLLGGALVAVSLAAAVLYFVYIYVRSILGGGRKLKRN